MRHDLRAWIKSCKWSDQTPKKVIPHVFWGSYRGSKYLGNCWLGLKFWKEKFGDGFKESRKEVYERVKKVSQKSSREKKLLEQNGNYELWRIFPSTTLTELKSLLFLWGLFWRLFLIKNSLHVFVSHFWMREERENPALIERPLVPTSEAPGLIHNIPTPALTHSLQIPMCSPNAATHFPFLLLLTITNSHPNTAKGQWDVAAEERWLSGSTLMDTLFHKLQIQSSKEVVF